MPKSELWHYCIKATKCNESYFLMLTTPDYVRQNKTGSFLENSSIGSQGHSVGLQEFIRKEQSKFLKKIEFNRILQLLLMSKKKFNKYI